MRAWRRRDVKLIGPVHKARAHRRHLLCAGDDFCSVGIPTSWRGSGRKARNTNTRLNYFPEKAVRSWNLHGSRALCSTAARPRLGRGRPRSLGDAGCTRAFSTWSLSFWGPVFHSPESKAGPAPWPDLLAQSETAAKSRNGGGFRMTHHVRPKARHEVPRGPKRRPGIAPGPSPSSPLRRPPSRL
jgi:hypothetical protein